MPVVTLVQTDLLHTASYIEVSMCVILGINDNKHGHAMPDVFSAVSSLVEKSV